MGMGMLGRAERTVLPKGKGALERVCIKTRGAMNDFYAITLSFPSVGLLRGCRDVFDDVVNYRA